MPPLLTLFLPVTTDGDFDLIILFETFDSNPTS